MRAPVTNGGDFQHFSGESPQYASQITRIQRGTAVATAETLSVEIVAAMKINESPCNKRRDLAVDICETLSNTHLKNPKLSPPA